LDRLYEAEGADIVKAVRGLAPGFLRPMLLSFMNTMSGKRFGCIRLGSHGLARPGVTGRHCQLRNDGLDQERADSKVCEKAVPAKPSALRSLEIVASAQTHGIKAVSKF
jgi:hypothetical protein